MGAVQSCMKCFGVKEKPGRLQAEIELDEECGARPTPNLDSDVSAAMASALASAALSPHGHTPASKPEAVRAPHSPVSRGLPDPDQFAALPTRKETPISPRNEAVPFSLAPSVSNHNVQAPSPSAYSAPIASPTAAASVASAAAPPAPEEQEDFFSDLGLSTISYNSAPTKVVAKKTPVVSQPVAAPSTNKFTMDSLMDASSGLSAGWGDGDDDLGLGLGLADNKPKKATERAPKRPAKKSTTKKKGLVQALDDDVDI